jgi:predicted HicB family RNase H-like nuclease
MERIEITPESRKSVKTSISLRPALMAVLQEEALLQEKSLSSFINDSLTQMFKGRVQNKIIKHADLYLS